MTESLSPAPIFIVIPVFNESQRIEKVIKAVSKKGFQMILVDDGSYKSLPISLRKHKKLQLVKHKINLGKGAAMKTGADLAFKRGAQAVIFMDGDGQHSIDDIDEFVNALNTGFEVVFGSRNLSYGVPLVRFLGNKLGSVVISLLFRIYISDLICGYRAITKSAYNRIQWESNRYGVETEIVIRTAREKLRYCEVPVETIYLDGVKGVSLLDAANILLDVIRWRFTL